MLSDEEGLKVVGGRLTATRQDTARKLEALVARAASGDSEVRVGGSMGVPTPGRRRPLSVIVAPIRGERFSMFVKGPTVVVCVTDLDAGVSLPEQGVRDLFGLTAAEARVAIALFEGLSPRQVGERMGLSFNTVRAHLAHILHKTETSGQVELTRLMMRVVGVGLG
jgi:DNA-binding CsgD family transcriptional regulator